MNLRISEAQWLPFRDALCARSDVETAGIILAEPAADGHVLVARVLQAFPEDGYLIRRPDQLRLDPVVLNRQIRQARDRGLAIFTVHTHPGATQPWFSLADDHGDRRLMPSFHAQADGPHGSVVVAGSSGVPLARCWSEGNEVGPVDITVVGDTLQVFGDSAMPRASAGTQFFDRQILALGAAGQTRLRRLTVGVVGLGGTGSVVAAQLAHLGIGRLVFIDGDLVEASNVSRIFGAGVEDVGRGKVAVAARYASGVGLGSEVVAHTGHLGDTVGLSMLEACDVVFSCVDRHTPRALLNRLSYAFLVPLIDMGSAFRVGPTGAIVGSAGRVVVVGPGRPCLGCWGHLDPRRLRIEALPADERAREIADGYIQGADVAQPSVVAFNTLVAGAGVVELLRLVTTFAGSDDPPQRLSFDFASGAVRRNRLAPGAACRVCGPRPARSEAC